MRAFTRATCLVWKRRKPSRGLDSNARLGHHHCYVSRSMPSTRPSRTIDSNCGRDDAILGMKHTSIRSISSVPYKHGVSHTALATACMRKLEMEQPKPLFYDPYAQLLSGKEGEAFLLEMESLLTDSAYVKKDMMQAVSRALVSVRHKFFDDYILEALAKIRGNKGPDYGLQFVDLASGLDSRAYRLAFPANVTMWEIDRDEVLSFKEAKLNPTGAKPICRQHTLIKADVVTDAWDKSLLDSGFDPSKPSVWLAEGLLPYLPPDEVTRLLNRVRSLSAAGSWFAADHASTGMMKFSGSKGILDRLKEIKAPLLSWTDDPKGLLESCGWDVPTIHFMGDKKAHYGRWPLRPVPSWIPLFVYPRFWLMTGMTSTSASKAA